MSAGGLPPVGAGALPPGLRDAPVATQREYRAALGFERVLLGQLTSVLAKNALGGSETASAASKAYQDLLPETLADSLVAAGGIGLAREVARQAAARGDEAADTETPR